MCQSPPCSQGSQYRLSYGECSEIRAGWRTRIRMATVIRVRPQRQAARISDGEKEGSERPVVGCGLRTSRHASSLRQQSGTVETTEKAEKVLFAARFQEVGLWKSRLESRHRDGRGDGSYFGGTSVRAIAGRIP